MFESVLDSFRHDDAFLDRLETVATEIRDTANAKGVISVQAADLQRFMTNPEGLQKSTKIWNDMRTFAPEVGSRLAEKLPEHDEEVFYKFYYWRWWCC